MIDLSFNRNGFELRLELKLWPNAAIMVEAESQDGYVRGPQ